MSHSLSYLGIWLQNYKKICIYQKKIVPLQRFRKSFIKNKEI